MSQDTPASTIAGHFQCIQCGYQLAGLSPQGVCPECGTPVAESIKGDGLAFASVEYLRTIARGLFMVRWAVLLTVVLFIGVVLTSALLWAHLPSWWAAVGARLVYLLPFGLNAVGWWLLTDNDPMLPPERDTISRPIARYSALAIVLAWAVRTAFAPLPTAMASAFEIAMPALVVGHVVAAGLFLRHLALRAPRRLVAMRARRVAFTGVLLAALLATGIGLNAAGLTGPRGPVGPGGALAGGLTALMVVIRLGSLVLFVIIASGLYRVTGQLRSDVRTFLARRVS